MRINSMHLNVTRRIMASIISIVIASFSTFIFTYDTFQSKSIIIESELDDIINYAHFRRNEIVSRYNMSNCLGENVDFAGKQIVSNYLVKDGVVICRSGFPIIDAKFDDDSKTMIIDDGVLIPTEFSDFTVYTFLHKQYIESRASAIFGNAFEYIELFNKSDVTNKTLNFGYYDLGLLFARVDIRLSYFVTFFISVLVFVFIVLIFSIAWFETNHSEEVKRVKDLSFTIKNKELHIHYQPIVDQFGSVRGFESLSRWSHPIQGDISPSDFILLAEKNQMMDELTDSVFEIILNELNSSEWRFKNMKISVNVPPTYIHSIDNIHKLESYYTQFKDIGYVPVIELTERDTISQESVHHLHILRGLGYLIAIDDFGTGFTGLSMLETLPIDSIKVDRFFVNSIQMESINMRVLETILELSKKLSLPIVAEGVETQEQADFLALHNCEFMQGYFYSKPLPWVETKKYLCI